MQTIVIAFIRYFLWQTHDLVENVDFAYYCAECLMLAYGLIWIILLWRAMRDILSLSLSPATPVCLSVY